MTTTLNTLTIKAQTSPKHRFQNLYGLLSDDLLYQSWGQLNKQAKPGVDGITIPIYNKKLYLYVTNTYIYITIPPQ